MSSPSNNPIALGPAHVIFTGRAEGDLGHGGAFVHEVRPEIEARRRAVLARPWSWLRQVHGNAIAIVTEAGGAAGAVADGSVTTNQSAALAVLTADCAPIALASPEGVVGVVHAGWRGLAVGVIERAIGEMRGAGGSAVLAAIGPCIHAECYEFGANDLQQFDSAVRATTTNGRPALDLPAAVHLALEQGGVEVVYDADECTACATDRYFSFRARAEMQRQAVVAWLP